MTDRFPVTLRLFRGRFLVALFIYWIGISCRKLSIAFVVDAGYIKFWWWR